ncbi:MAG: SDR family oxidoreductase [Gammaproteobacteria bacterium]|nr:SDR family oxidoreductase [Gammaproteobacteria bacterium]MYD76969.1 SDR family oxidoreductase [Gammaproteobacteria bacterium]MYJ51756.1 SDR family oxidoreductase [Gammaproteobacteria bacterium]
MNSGLVITGAGRGIGAATAILAAQAGWRVVINYRENRAAAESVCRRIHETGGDAAICRADVADDASVENLFAFARREFGPVRGLVNNAGTLESSMRVEEMDGARIDRILSTNVKGSLLCAREAVRCMSVRRGGEGGSIVNISSVAARLGSPNEFVDYAASKGAIDTFTVGLAGEVAEDGIRVNAVRPGLIDTEIHALSGEPDRIGRISPHIPMQRPGTAEEVARAIVWLLSDESSYCTGALIDCAGGR